MPAPTSAPSQSLSIVLHRRATETFFEKQKTCPDFDKKALIMSIPGLNLPFKMEF